MPISYIRTPVDFNALHYCLQIILIASKISLIYSIFYSKNA